MNFSYTLYQAETVKNARVQREADARTGELAQSFARLRRSVLPARRHPGTGGPLRGAVAVYRCSASRT